MILRHKASDYRCTGPNKSWRDHRAVFTQLSHRAYATWTQQSISRFKLKLPLQDAHSLCHTCGIEMSPTARLRVLSFHPEVIKGLDIGLRDV